MASRLEEIKKKMQASQPEAVSVERTSASQGSTGGSRVRDIKRKMVADVDGKYIQSFLNDARDHVTNTQREYEGLTWQNARSEEVNVSRANASAGMNQRARKVRTYLDAYKEKIPEEQYTALKQYLDDFDSFQNQSAASFRNAYAQFSQFETEDDYSAYTTFWKQLGEDIPALDRQIADLESEYETFDWTDAAQREKMHEYEAKVSQMKAYRKQAAAVQANKAAQEDLENRLAAYSGNTDWDKLSKGIDASVDPDRKSDYGIVFELSRSNIAYDKGTALANGTTEAEWNDIDQKRRYISKKYGVDLYADIYDNANIFNEIMAKLDEYSFEGGELSQQLLGETIGNSFKNMRHLTEDEKSVLNYIFYTQGRDAALQWHNSRMNIYQDRANGVLTEEMLKWGKEAPILSSVASVAMSLGSGIEQIGDWISGDYNNSLARASSAIRSGVSERVDLAIGNWDAFDFLYNTGMSGVDSLAASAFGKAGSVVLGLSAAAQATNDAMDRGMPKKQAFWHGLMSGVFECLFERWSIGNFKALKEVEPQYFKDAVKNLAKTMLVNASEEACTEVANIAYDTIINGDFSQYEALVWQNVADGMSEPEAKRNAALKLSGQVTEAAASGTLMGLGFGVTGLSHGALKNASRKVRFNKALKNFENAQLKEFAPQIIAEALELKPDNTQAIQLKAQLDSGKELGTGDFKALRTLAKESTIAVDSETAVNRLKELGETGDVAAISKAAAKLAVGEKLTAAEKNILSQSQYAKQVVEELAKQQEAEFDTAETQPLTAQQTNSTDFDTVSIHAENVPETQYEVSADNQTIQKSTGEAVAIQRIASVKDGRMTFQTADGTEVDVDDVSFGSRDEAQIYKAVASLGGIIDAETANNLSKHLLKLGKTDSDTYVRGVIQAYQYGYYGYSRNRLLGENTLTALLTEEQRNVAYGYGKKLADADGSSGKSAAKRTTRRKGRVMSWGIPIEQLRRSFNSTQKQAYDIITAIAEVTGIDVVLYRSKADADGNFRGGIVNGIDMSDSQGAFSWHNSKIYIDVNAGLTHKSQMNDLAMYSMLRTFSHEFVHFIEKHNPVEYENFRDLVFEVMKEKGSDPDEMIDAYMMQHRNSTRDEASREVVAEAMTDILPESQFVERLAQKHQGIFKKLLEQLKAFIKEIKDHFAHIGDTSAPEVAAVREQIDGAVRYAEKIVEAFDRVAVEAVERYHEGAPAQKNTAEGGGMQHSFSRTSANHNDYIPGVVEGKEIEDNIRSVAAMSSVTTIKSDEFRMGDGRLLADVAAFFETIGGSVYNNRLGKIFLRKRGVKNDLGHGMSDEKATSFAAIPAVLEHGKVVGFVVNKGGKGFDSATVVAPITIGQDPYMMGVIVHRSNNENTFYLHDVFATKEEATPLITGTRETGKPGGVASTISIIQRILDVKNNIGKNPGESKTEQHQHRTTTLSNRMILEKASQAVDSQKLTPGQRSTLQVFQDHLDKLRELETKKEEQQKIIDDARKRGARQVEYQAAINRRNILTTQINRESTKLLEVENTPVLRRVLEQAKNVIVDEQTAIRKQALTDYRKKRTESRERTEARHKILRVTRELDALLQREDKKHHVPDSMKNAVAAALDLLELDTVNAAERIAKYDALIAQATDQDVIDSLTVTRENIKSQGEKIGARLKELHAAYAEIMKSEDPDISAGYDPVIDGNLKELAESIGDTPFSELSVEQLEDVYSMYKMVLARVRDANKSLTDSRNATISQRSLAVIRQIRAAGGSHKYLLGSGKANAFWWNNLKPIYAIEKLGSPALKEAFWSLIEAEGGYARDIKEASDFADKMRKEYGYDKWDMKKKYSFKSTSGIEFELTLEQVMSLYAFSRREQALDHLRIGGFVFDSNIETYKVTETVDQKTGETKQKRSILKYRVNTADAHQLSQDILTDIISVLDAKQAKFVEEMQGYLSDTMGAKGNEVSMAMYGIKLFKEKHYWPLKSSNSYMFQQNEMAREVRIKNAGFTQKTKPKANNPIILQNFMDVWAGHVHDMSMYHSFTLPLEDFNRIFNFATIRKEGEDPAGVKMTIQNAYGKEAVDYVRQMIIDLNGGARSDTREGMSKQLMGKFKKAAVAGSLSVAIQQPSALNRAKALIPDKYFLTLNPRLLSTGKLWEECKTYAPVAVIKEMGKFDMDTGIGTINYIKSEKKGLMDVVDDVTGWLPAKADEWTWVQIWAAVKKETAARHPELVVSSKQFLEAAGKRFTEVIVKTQVYDSTLSRSAFMRSKSGLLQMTTSFMAEPTTSINMIEDAIRQYKRGYRQQATKTARAVLDSMVANAVLVSLIYALRDDDEDETFVEKYFSALTSEIVDGLNPLTYIPWVKDAWSIAQGFDVERSDMSLISDIADALTTFGKLCAKDTDAMSETELSEHRRKIAVASWGLVEQVANFFGLPMRNVRRDVMAFINTGINTVQNVKNGIINNPRSFWSEIKEAVQDVTPVLGWFNDSKSDKLYDALAAKDTAQINRLKIAYCDDEGKFNTSAYRSAVRKGLRENDSRIRTAAKARLSGDYTKANKLLNQIAAEGRFDRSDISAAIKAEYNHLKGD